MDQPANGLRYVICRFALRQLERARQDRIGKVGAIHSHEPVDCAARQIVERREEA